MKIIKHISILIITILFMSFLSSYAQYSNTIVSIHVSFDDNNKHISADTQSITFGSKISLDQSIENNENYTFLHWIVNGVIHAEYSLNHEFNITSTLNLHAIFYPSDKVVATFIDSNGIVLDFQYITPGGSASDTSITLPNKPGYIIAPFKWNKPLSPINQHTTFTLQYLPDNLSEHTVSVTNGTGNGQYQFNSLLTITANPAPSNKYFQYWTSNGNIISYDQEYTFTVLFNTFLTAVYGDEPVLEMPLVNLSPDLAKRTGYKSYVAQLSYPEGYELIEYGIITSQNTPSIALSSSTIQRYQGISIQPNTKEYVMSITDTSHTYARAYIVVRNSQNQILEFYSPAPPLEETFLEPFNTNIGASYVNGSFTGTNGVLWEYVHARNQDIYPIDGTGILLRRASEPSSLTVTLPNGLKSFSFDTRKAYTGDAVRTLVITVSDAQDNILFQHTTPTLNYGSGASSFIIPLSFSNMNFEGQVKVRIHIGGTGDTNRHVVIDNFEWTSYQNVGIQNGYLLNLISNTDTKPTVDIVGPYYSYEEELTMTAPTVTDYTFLHWIDVRTNEIISESNPYIFDIIQNTAIKAIYAPNHQVADYTIEYYYQNIEDENYTFSSLTTLTRPIGEVRTIQPQQYGFTVNEDLSILSGVVSDITPLVLKVYYERNIYTIDYIVDDTLYDTQDLKYQEIPPSITSPYKPSDPFLGWSVLSIGRNLYNVSLPITQNLTLYAVFESTPDYVYEGYYTGASGLEGTSLVSFLRTLVNTNFTRRSYDEARQLLEVIDRDPDSLSNVLTIYDRQSVKGLWDGGVTWNREHVWPNSRLGIPRVTGSSRNIGSDLHNLRAAIPSTNSSRSNKVFDYVTTADTYFPGNQDKGDVARILFYMVIAYSELELVDYVLANDPATNYTLAGAKMSLISRLLVWHVQDPVDDFERTRNQEIFNAQGNRNPFIDHPQFVELIWGPIELSNGQNAFFVQYESGMVVVLTTYEVDLNLIKKNGVSL